MENQTAGPSFVPSSEPKQPIGEKGFRIRAIVAGMLTDFIATSIVSGCYGGIIGFRMGTSLAEQGLSQAETQAQLQKELQDIVTGSVLLLVIGVLFSVLGGYVAGRIAKRNELNHGLLTGIAVIVLGLFLTLVFPTTATVPVWRLVLGFALTIGGAALGGYLASLQRAKTTT